MGFLVGAGHDVGVLCDWLLWGCDGGVMVVVVVVVWGLGWNVGYSVFGGNGWFEEGGVENGEDVHGRWGWDGCYDAMDWGGELGGLLEVGSEGSELIDKEE